MDALAPELVYEKLLALHPAELRRKMVGERSFNPISSAVDIACWDVLGHVGNLPLYKIFGGYNDKVPCYYLCLLQKEKITRNSVKKSNAC